MKKALLIGSNGFLGDYWSHELASNNFETFGIAKGLNNGYIKPVNFTDFDVTDSNWAEFIENFINVKRPEIIVFNSGIDSPPGNGFSNIHDFSIKSWKEVFEVNFFSAISMLNAVNKIEDYKCRIILIGSQYATLAPSKRLYDHNNHGEGSVKHPAYSASKTALKAAMKQYATELAESGIIINMLSPGGIFNNQDEEFVRKFSERSPVKRLGERNELGSALSFLIDEKNSFCVGLDLLVDGGYSLW